MRKYLFCEAGFVEKANWQPNCWINIECPDAADFHFLQEQLKVPQSFLNDIADTDERPRTETEGNWLLTILRNKSGSLTTVASVDLRRTRKPFPCACGRWSFSAAFNNGPTAMVWSFGGLLWPY